MQLTSGNGPYKTAQAMGTTGTIVYPTDAEPPFAAVAICPGFLNTGPEMAPWGPFYASYGIVTAVTNTGAADLPDQRGKLLLAAIEELKKMNADSKSPLFGKLSGRYGTSGYSMGGGGTTIIAQTNATLKTSVGLAPWGGSGSGTMVPELLFCGDADTVAPCNMAQSVYTSIPAGTPKMMITVPGATHFNWFSPTDAGGGESGKYGLAFQKVYLEGDVRWKSLLLQKPTGGSVMTDIQ
jgi:dienelactone hydrolase